MRADMPSSLRLLRRATWVVLLSAAVSAGSAGRSSGAEAVSEASLTMKIEAESYWWGHNAGGEALSVSTCAVHSSGGKAVRGLDYAGDWIMLAASVSDPIFFKISLHAAAEMGLRAGYAIEFLPPGPGVIPATDALVTPPGRGAG